MLGGIRSGGSVAGMALPVVHLRGGRRAAQVKEASVQKGSGGGGGGGVGQAMLGGHQKATAASPRHAREER